MPFQLSYKPSPIDMRDCAFNASRHPVLVSEANVVLPMTTPLSDQGGLSACVANAGCDSVELLAQKPTQLSRLAAYYWSRWLDDQQNVDGGTYVRSFFKSATKMGICKEDFWPYNEPEVNREPSLMARENAYDHRIKSYYRILGNVSDDTEAAIRSGHPVVFGVEVGKEFLEYGGADYTFTPPARSEGGHALVVVGVQTGDFGRRFLIRNSWGASWGLKDRPGHCWFSPEYLENAYELWVPTQSVLS